MLTTEDIDALSKRPREPCRDAWKFALTGDEFTQLLTAARSFLELRDWVWLEMAIESDEHGTPLETIRTQLAGYKRKLQQLRDTTEVGLLLADVEFLRERVRVAMSAVSNGEMPSWDALNAAYESTEPGHARRETTVRGVAVAEEESSE